MHTRQVFRQPITPCASHGAPVRAQLLAFTLAALMTFGTLGSIHTISVGDAPAGTLARMSVVPHQA